MQGYPCVPVGLNRPCAGSQNPHHVAKAASNVSSLLEPPYFFKGSEKPIDAGTLGPIGLRARRDILYVHAMVDPLLGDRLGPHTLRPFGPHWPRVGPHWSKFGPFGPHWPYPGGGSPEPPQNPGPWHMYKHTPCRQEQLSFHHQLFCHQHLKNLPHRLLPRWMQHWRAYVWTRDHRLYIDMDINIIAIN